MSVKIRFMLDSDLDFAIDLANREHWDYDQKDVNRLRTFFPKGCFVAEQEGVRAGWIVACTYDSLAWISSLVVESSLRGRGVGAALVDYAVQYARKIGAKTVGLYSYRESVGFYEKMGFRQDCAFEYVTGKGHRVETEAIAQRVKDSDEIAELDRKYFRGDRKTVLEHMRRNYPDLFLKLEKTSAIGYIAGKRFSDGSSEIGPWVCDPSQAAAAEQLFANEVNKLRSGNVNLTIPVENKEACRIVGKHMFQVKHRVLRMFAGRHEDLPSVDGVYAAAGLDIG